MAKSESSKSPAPDELLGAFVGDTYLIGHVIGKGSFGSIRLCNAGRPKHFVVAKVEVKRAHKRSRLYDEFNMLQNVTGGLGFPKVYYYSSLLGHNLMVLEMLGPNLDELMLRCGGVFSIRTVALIGLQLMDRIEFLHSHRILYRDIKGENLLIGLFDHHNRVYLVDFGLCKHVLKEDGVNYTPVGTPRYMSLRTHEGKASTYRDDVESIGYLLIYFCLGHLPWQGLPAASSNSKITIIAQKKIATSLEELCKGLPIQLIHYLEAARKLDFNEFPNYNYFRQLVRIICKNFNSDGDRYLYDWQRPGIKLTVFPKITQPTAISQKHDVVEQNVVDLRPASREWRSAFAGRPHGDGVSSFTRKMRKGSLGVIADAVGSTSSSLLSQPRQTSLLTKKKFTRF